MSNLSDERWSSLSALLDDALDLPDAERATWLADLRQRDPVMADLVADALCARGSEDFQGFLQGPSPISVHDLSSATLVGRRIGAYAIDAEIGRGGMGSVWRAHRTDGRYEGRVAIKFVHASLIGRAGEQRFQQEGQVLSRLNHPNIARLLDAGVVDQMQPYLVLEFVEGEALDAYCEHHAMSLPARLDLFLNVLEAVAHAHANLIVHRDLKPSNVLVTPDGTVKLLDFGIAKLIDDAQSAPQTQLSAVALTPLYAAPEQMLGEPITTATDVYALGLMLYALLTGRHPTAADSRSRADLIHSVLNAEAPRASKVARLSTVDARALAGDLDSVLQKAIEKSPGARYASAAAFADDLRRYLADEPVLARPDTIGYRARKFVVRHRLGATLASIAALALVTSAVISALQTRRASQAAAVALAERGRADQSALQARQQRDLALAGISQAQDLSELTMYLLGEALPEDQPKLREQVLMRGVVMVRASKTVAAARRAQLLEQIATNFENDRDFKRALELYTEAQGLASQGDDPAVQASTSCHIAQMQATQGRPEEALAATDHALATLPAGSRYADPKIICHLTRSQILLLHGQPALPDLEAAARYLQDLLVPNQWLELDVVSMLTAAYANTMRVPQAMNAFKREEQLQEQTGGAHIRNGMVHLFNQSVFLWKIGQPLAARSSLDRAQQINRERGINEDDASFLLQKARIAAELADAPTAVAGYERALKKARASGDLGVDYMAQGEQVSTWVRAGEFARAERALPDVEQRLHRAFAADHWMFGKLRMQAALLEEQRGAAAAAQRLADESIRLLEQGPGRDSYQFPSALVQKSGIELRAGNLAAARADAGRALQIYDTHFGPTIRSASIGDALLALGKAEQAAGNAALAHEKFARAALHYESTLGLDHPQARAARQL